MASERRRARQGRAWNQARAAAGRGHLERLPVPLTQGRVILRRVGAFARTVHAGSAGFRRECAAGLRASRRLQRPMRSASGQHPPSCCCTTPRITMATAETWLGDAARERLRALTEDPTAAWAAAVEAGARSDRLTSDALISEATAGGLRFVCISDTHGKHFAFPELPAGEASLRVARPGMTGDAGSARVFGRQLQCSRRTSSAPPPCMAPPVRALHCPPQAMC